MYLMFERIYKLTLSLGQIDNDFGHLVKIEHLITRRRATVTHHYSSMRERPCGLEKKKNLKSMPTRNTQLGIIKI